MSGSVNNALFGPLGSQYCALFYWLAFFALVMIIVTVLGTMYIGFTTKKWSMVLVNLFPLVAVYGLMYFQNRIFYGMCSRSLQ